MKAETLMAGTVYEERAILQEKTQIHKYVCTVPQRPTGKLSIITVWYDNEIKVMNRILVS
jgi:hypothetical protein